MDDTPPCPQCSCEFTYELSGLFVCPECAHEWSVQAGDDAAEATPVIRDAVGNVLADGDSVTLIKDLKLGGSSHVLKGGTKAKNIRLVDGDHEISCKIDGMAVGLKACFVRKA